MNALLFRVVVATVAGGSAGWGQGVDRTPPHLVSVVPPSPASSVATTQAVAFRFSEAMNTSLLWMDVRFLQASPPPQSLGFQAQWSGDQRTLTCRPQPEWPAGATVAWRLGTNFIDRAGNRMTNVVLGGFDTAATGIELPPSGTHALTRFSVLRLNRYVQSAADTVDPELGAEARFVASTVLASNRTASVVRLTTPLGAALDLARDPGAPEQFDYTMDARSAAELDWDYPWGNYRFEVLASTPSAPRFVYLPPAEPPPPVLADFASLGRVDPAQPFRLAWQPWPDAVGTDVIRVEIGDGLVQSPGPGEPGALPGTASEFVVPAGVLDYQSTYSAAVSFHSVRTLMDSGAGEETVAERTSRTAFVLRTQSDPAGAPVFSAVVRQPTGLQVGISGPPGRSLVVETNAGLLAAGWIPAYSTNTGNGTVTLFLPVGNEGRVFFRAWIP